MSDLAPGQMKVVEWRDKPVWLLRHTPDMPESFRETDNEIADPKSDVSFIIKTSDYCKNETRPRTGHKDLLVMVGIRSHLGCSPPGPFPVGTSVQLAGDSGFVYLCHGSIFDLADYVFKNKSVPQNFDVPPYMFLSDTKLVIGKGERGEA